MILYPRSYYFIGAGKLLMKKYNPEHDMPYPLH